jgi:DNA-3-methyladenine glycosylase II
MLPPTVTLFNDGTRRPSRYNRRMSDTLAYTLESAEVRHLMAADGTLGELIGRIGPLEQRLETDRYASLASAIVAQQLSDKAASTIWGRLVAALEGDPTPERILAADDTTLRGAGLSGSKTAFLRDLAMRVADGSLDLDRVAALPDEDVIAALTEVKGIGRWTAEMFLIFSLGRPDVLAIDDGALRSTVTWLYGLDAEDDRTAIARIGEAWSPYRTCASLYLWSALDVRRAAERERRAGTKGTRP